MSVSPGPGMPSASLLVNLLSALFIPFVFGETEIRFAGQTEFVVNETSTTVIRLVVERIGDPANVTAIVSLYGDDTGDFFDTYAATFIPFGETNRTVYIAVCDDDFPEPDETFIFHLTLQKPSANVKLGWPRTVTVTILSNDNAFGIISFNMPFSITVNEPRGRNESVPLTLIREKGTYGMVTVTFEVVGGPYPPEEDLSPVKGNITFPPGKATVAYNLTVLDDEVPENDEIFLIQLKSVEGGAEINTSRSSVEIIVKKNDSPVRFIQNVYLVPEEDHILTIPVVRGKDDSGNLIGSDDCEVSISYVIITGNSTAHAQQNLDFIDLQPNTTIVFPPFIYESHLKFQIVDDAIPEIAESFQVMLLKDTLRGDAVLLGPSVVQVTIKPNDKPYGVLSFNSVLFERTVIIDEDTTTRFEEITVVRNGGTHGNVSVNWVLTRNSSDPSPVTTDIRPRSGVLHFAQGQMLASVPLTVINDDLPEEAEAYLLQILPHTIRGGAEVSEPAELLFYIQDSDDVYGLITFFPVENQKIESSPGERCLSLSLTRLGGTKGDVKIFYSAFYIPAGAVDPLRAKDGILNISKRSSLIFPEQKTQVTIKLPIRNDAFLQNGAHFLVQLEAVELVNVVPPIPPISPRFGEIQNISLVVTPDIANGEIGFISNLPIILHEPEDFAAEVVCISLHRDGTDGQATVHWSLKPSGFNSKAVTLDDIGPFNGSVVFLSGQSDTTINITVKADDIPEMNETVTLSLDRVSVENQVLKSGYTSRDLIILENDDPGGVFEFSPASRGPYIIKEGESVELHIIRHRGALVKQFLHYRIEPRDSNEFYGNTGVLEFKPGEREIVITLLTRLDGIPELDEHYWVVLTSHGERESKLGSATVVNITILKNDDPHGIIEFVSDDLIVTINESKGDNTYSAIYGVIRNRGNFGDVNVSWVVSPDFTQDVFPVRATIFFGDQEFLKNITIYSLPDEIPEEMEEFTIILLNATGGAKIGNKTTATLRIRRNDDPIYFAEPRVVRVREGETADFKVLRNGSVDVPCTVQYATMDGKATAREGDFVPIEKGEMLTFAVGSRQQNISVFIMEDDIPETDEPFYIILFNSTGDTVVYPYAIATVIIEANDDPNGIFSLEPIDKAVEEGKTNSFWILRHRGHFGNVSVAWQLFQNDSALQPGQEFYETSGTVNFMDGEGAKPIILHAFPDKIPEFNEFYILKLVNISGGSPGPGGQLAATNLQVTVMIPFNDDPFGVFILDPECLEREVAEDVLSEDAMSYITNFTVLRQQGAFGDVRVGWEVLSSEFTAGLPPVIDFLLVGVFPSTVHSQPHMRRHHSGTDALYFSGLEGAFGTVNPKYHPSRNNSIANFTFSAWVMPNANTNGFVIAKDDGNGGIYYGVKIHTNESHVTLSLHYKTLGSNATYVAKTTVMKYLEENVWLHLLIVLDDGIIEFYLDGNAMPRGIKSLKGEAITDGPGTLRIGAGVNGNDRFTGLMQDVRSYERKLTLEEIYELHAMPAKSDLHPVSGYLEFRQGETNKSFIISARDDNEEEGEELFILKLVSVYGGARLSEENTTARLVIQKSDNANGLFGFTGSCIPEIAEEGSTVSCVVERTRGALDYVHVFYTISQIESDGVNYLVDDFANVSGSITFLPWQRSEVLNIYVLDDDIPELNEYFRVTLVSAIPGDGKIGSTPTSGASIDPEKETTDITIKASDHPYGLLQFSTGPPPQPEDTMTLPASSVPHVTVQEEDGEVRLLVVRAQGLLGRVMAEYRTVSLTAFSPEDYQSVAGTLEFQPGERFKYISVNITDNSIPELEKSFKVELLNLEGGVTELFRVDGSGSGDGDMEFFLPANHRRASLGVASQVLVTIAASDHAHGVFEFSPESLAVSGTEPEDGYSTVIFNIMRSHGALSRVILLWSIDSDPDGDLAFTSGNVTFEIGQKSANITVEILPDEDPELDKTFSVTILSVSSGSLGVHTNATLIVLASDDPYGVFIFSEKNRPIKVEEATQNITLSIIRLKGLLGKVKVTYATLDDMEKPPHFPPNLARATQGKDYIPASGFAVFRANQSEATITVSVLDDDEPERSESLFVELLNSTLTEKVQNRPIPNSPRLGSKVEAIAQLIIIANDDAFGILQLSAPVVRVAENHVGPIINVTRTGGAFADVSVKFKAVPITAVAGEDYSIASSDVVLLEGETSKVVPIYVINDIYPELEESFLVQLLNETTGGAKLGALTEAIIFIEASDDPYGLFGFQITKLTVEEPEFNSVKVNLPIIRNSGTLGNVTVQWVATINGQLATGDLRVVSGETKKVAILTILDDSEPEDDEIIVVSLVYTEGGSRILPSSDTVRVNILANDNVAGVVSFQTASRSVIGHEGETLQFHVIRTPPGRGNVTVNWKIIGQNLELNFANSTGQLFFPEGSLNKIISVHLLDDNIPEEKEVYQVILYDVRTQGVSPAGAALLDAQGYAAVLTVEASDEPHGVLNFALSSRFVLLQEANTTIKLFINREFGSLGAINVTYATVPGMLSRKNQTEGNLAEPDVDFVPVVGFLILEEGETAGAIDITILEDDIPELEECFLVNLTHVELIMAPFTSFPPRLDSEGLTAQIIIDANDGARGVIEWQLSRFEVNETQGSLTLVAQRRTGALGPVSLLVYAQNLEAQLGVDYAFTPMILHFANGERHKNVDIMILDDDIPEGDEAFQLILTNPSSGLELGENIVAFITILANDDGPGVLSFNNSEHFFLREPTAVYVQESMAVLYVVREPAQGLFGTVTVQFIVTEVNSSVESKDLAPSKGYVVLEEGVRFKALHIFAILDTEPEMDEHFVCTLFNPTGGARLGAHVQTLITILQNQAPLGLFSISAVANRGTSVNIEEANRTVYLSVSRTNGIDLAVSVEWETVSETAFGMRGMDVTFSTFQSFLDASASGWCFFTLEDSVHGLMLRKLSSTLYRWQGIFVPFEVSITYVMVHRLKCTCRFWMPPDFLLFLVSQDLSIENPKTCEAFNIGLSSYFVITHEERNKEKSSVNSVYMFTSGFKLFLVQTINISESSQVRYFTSDSQDYLIVASQSDDSQLTQVFRWNGGSFVWHQTLSVRGVLSMALFTRGGTVFLAIAQANARSNSLLLRWSSNEFTNFQEVPISGTTQVEALTSGDDIYLIFVKTIFLGDQNSVDIFVWEAGQSSFRYFQSLDFAAVNKIHSFTPASGIVHLLLLGQAVSALYCWNSELNHFSLLLEAPSASDAAFVTVKSLNSSKNLIALAGATHSHIYELAYVSSQSDFIPSSGELIFEPGDKEAIIAVNVLDDTVPEEDESFRVQLKNPKGGAEIGINGYVQITILSNDDAYGVVGFAQNSLYKQVEEMEQDSLLTLNVERLKGTYGRITVAWEADGSISDIFPTSGVISFSEGQALSTITLTVLADDLPELSEIVIVTLIRIITEGVEDPSKGATIDQKRNKSVITTLPNDSPYGLVGWHAESLFIKVAEPKENVTALQLQIVRDKGLLGDIAIQLVAKPNFLLHINNQATENEDYVLQETMIIMKENIKETYVKVAILPDDVPELEEGFIVSITEVRLVNSDFSAGQPSVQRPGLEMAEIMIEENDDPRGIFKFHITRDVAVITAYEVPPPMNVLQVPVVRLAGSFGEVKVYWKATVDSAGLEDFKPSHGILEFADRQVIAVIEITIIDDDEFELMEMFNISLIKVAGGGRLGDDVVVTVVIPQNDSPFGVFGFEEKTVMVDESLLSDDPDSYVTLTVVRSPGGKGAVRLQWTIDEMAKDDLSPLSGTLHFDETDSQKTIVLHTLQDATLEEDRRFTIQLLSVDEVEISPVKGSASIIIRGDKGASGEVGIAPSSRHVLIGEPSAKYNGTAIISLIRGPAISGEVTVSWRIVPPSLEEFAETSGKLTMRDGQSAAIVVIQALNDDLPEEKRFYEFQLTGVSEGGVLSESSTTANITMVASDFPYGRFAFSQEQLRVTEEVQKVNLTVIRSGGSFGRVRLCLEAVSGTAEVGVDFLPPPVQLLFEARETVKSVHIEILDDSLPEGPEEFSLVMTDVELLGRGYDFTIQENGLQIDQPPEIGNISIVRIIIMKNDNAEGIIEFDPRYTTFEVEEDIGTIMIPVQRLHGAYGRVTADLVSQSSSAVPGGVDYVLHGSSVTFQHGQNLSFINVSIIDDDESEFEEPIEIMLVGATGGAVLGRHLVCRITIAKSDSPFGVIRFLNQSRVSVPNPSSTVILPLMLERTGGLLGEIQVNWEIVGPNSQEALPSQNQDIADPVSGSFSFGDGEGGVRSIILGIYPHDDIEIEKTFIIKLKLVKGEAQLDSTAKDITLTIEKFGDPNGVIQFAPESLSEETYLEPSTLEGPLIITFFVRRIKGVSGEIMVYWELSSEFDITGDFLSTKGIFTIADGDSEASFDVHLLPDDIPEIEEVYVLQLVSVKGGAKLDTEKCVIRFSVSANDDPHGIFALYSDHQSVLIGQNLRRLIQINVTRLAGTFGDVAVRYRISSDSKAQSVVTENAERQLVVRDGTRYKVDSVPVQGQVFLPLGSNFTLQLVTVMLVGGSFYGVPKILQEAKSAMLPVPEKAANSQVGFESTAFPLTDIAAGTSQAVISRRGTYGSLKVSWAAGYVPGSGIPEFTAVGNMTPKVGRLSFSHGEESRRALLWTHPSPGRLEAFVIHLFGVQSSVPGGAQLRSGFTVAEIEPMGVFQFSPSSRNIIVSEDTQMIRLHVQRLFGFHGELIKVSYQTTAGRAKPQEDFEAVQNGELLFGKFQVEVDFEIIIIDDELPEIEEIFYINLTSVEIKGLPKFDANWRPRLNRDFSVAVITILDNDDLAGTDTSFTKTAVTTAVNTALPLETDSATTHPDTTEITAIPQPTEVVAMVTEVAGVSPIPEDLVTLAGTSAMSEKPNAATVTTDTSVHGTFSLGPPVVYVEEEMENGTLNAAEVLVRRTGGSAGNVSVTVRTFGETSAQKEPNALPFPDSHRISNLTWATEEEDFGAQTLILAFVDGERERKVSIPILDDGDPEGQEFFYVFLTDPQGGAQIVKGEDDAGFAAFAMIVITGSDLHNGIIGFSEESQSRLELGEETEMSSLRLTVTRQPNRAFEDVKVFWRVTFNKTAAVLQKDGVSLVDQLLSVAGTTVCMAGQTKGLITIELKPGKIPQSEIDFFVELYEVTAGAALNNSARFAQIKLLQREKPPSLVYFSVGSRLPVAHKKATLISLQVAREYGAGLVMSVNFSTQELRSSETIGRTLISPAISGKDFVRTEGTLIFEPGQRTTVLDVILTPETGSLNPFPKRFQIVLFDPRGGAGVDKVYGTANITLVSDTNSQAFWGLADQLQQPLDGDILNRVLHSVSVKVATENTDEQLSAVLYLIDKITIEGKQQALSIESRNLFYEILCALVNPKRKDTRGFSHFTEVTENFAFSLLTDVTCGSPGEKGKTILDSCPYLSILALHWYPQQINGHKFEGKEGDYIRVPERLLDVLDAEIMAGRSTCELVQFTEYSSQQWFMTGNNFHALKNKVLSLSVKGQSSQPLTNSNEILYRIYAAEPRIVPKTPLCLLWNPSAASWLSDSQFCKVVEDTSGYVECACSYMSVYAVYAQTDNLSSYNEAFFSSGFICISGLCLAVLSHIFCARYSMFAAKLLTHMLAASLGTQIVFLASAYASPQLTEESCSAIAAVTHYLYLCQFSWMLIQSVNFWYVLVMNDEHTERRYLLFLLLSWGLPALVVILLIVVLRAVYHQSMPQIYGLIHSDLCFIPNVYAALFTAALVPVTCLVVVFVVFTHAYQVKPQWRAYDDVFRGRTNAAEIPLVLYLFALISMTWLWGGLHMAYRHFWMLVLFVIFNSLQGLYVFVVYFILHNQTCCPMKASYTVEMNGHPGPSTTFFTPGSGMPAAGGEISKSTQNLISAMEEVPPDWERTSFQQASQASPDLKPSPQNGATFPSSGGYGQGSLVADEESQEFDDLIFALKTGAGLSVSDNESGQGSQEGGTLTDSQIVELRRIPIADTHL
uniref:Adhesion G-protein coupled receptor V1 n=1 Tax=Capra hircus TaxID=9925 RepID=A0A452G4T7_CAPHI